MKLSADEIRKQLEEAQLWEEQGRSPEAIQIYCKILGLDGVLEVNEIYYRMGLGLLENCQHCFQSSLYVQAADFLIRAYNLRYCRDEIWNILYTIAYLPNEEAMKRQYEENRKAALTYHERYSVCLFDELPVCVFPIDETAIRVFDRRTKRFLAYGQSGKEVLFFVKMLLSAFEQEREFFLDVLRGQQAAADYKRLWGGTGGGSVSLAALKKLKQYGAADLQKETALWLLANAFYENGGGENAEKSLRASLKCRPLYVPAHLLLGRLYEQAREYIKAAHEYGLLMKIVRGGWLKQIQERVAVCAQAAQKISPEYFLRFLENFALSQSKVSFGNFRRKYKVNENGVMEPYDYTWVGQFLSQETQAGYFIGVYNENGRSGQNAALAETLNQAAMAWLAHSQVKYVLLNGAMEKEYICKQPLPFVLPIIATEREQNVAFAYGEDQIETIQWGKYEAAHFRITEPVKIFSQQDLVFGRPIALGHSKKRKKLILDLFIDALSFSVIKNKQYALIPNILKFFQKGAIFANNYAVAEYTYPSLASIETGRYMNKTKIFHPQADVGLSEALRTNVELLKEQGYYCVSVMGGWDGISNNVYRSFDKMIVDFDKQAVGAEGIERLIRHIDAFGETDQYALLHLMDVHRRIMTPAGLQTEAQKSFKHRVTSYCDQNIKSVFERHSDWGVFEYEESVKNVDRMLASLFAYIERHYQDEEVLISLYSDHGVSIYSEPPYVLSEEHGGTALMIRGGGVPALGMVEDEITSVVDLYAMKAKYCGWDVDAAAIDGRLPRALGGEGHTHVVMNSLYPGQTYKMCIRTMEHEFQLETRRPVHCDGTVDFSEFNYKIFCRRTGNASVRDTRLAAYFLKIAWNYVKSFECADELFEWPVEAALGNH